MDATLKAPNRPLRVLLVEDDADHRMLLSCSLQRRGYEVREACGVAEARLVLESDALDVVISDMHFADGTGAEVAQFASARVGRVTGAASPLLLALSGLDYREDQAGRQTLGFDRYFLKPTSVRELAATIAERYPD